MITSSPSQKVATSYFTVKGSSTVPPVDLNEVRNRGDRMLRDLAFVLHLTQKVKKQILAEQDDGSNEDAGLVSAHS